MTETQAATTHLSTGSDGTSGEPLTELTDEQILERFGDLMWSAIVAFGADVRYWTAMVESANVVQYKRRLWAHRSDPERHAMPELPARRRARGQSA